MEEKRRKGTVGGRERNGGRSLERRMERRSEGGVKEEGLKGYKSEKKVGRK